MSSIANIEQDDSVPWHQAPKGSVFKYLTAYIDSIMQDNSRRFTDYVRFAALYGNWETAQMTAMFLTRGVQTWRNYKRLSFNVCQSMVDTVVNQRASEAPELMAVSQDGDYRAFVRARMLTQAIRQEFKASNHEMKFPRVVHNAACFGNGYAGVERYSGQLKIQRIFSPEIVLDPYDNTVDGWPGVVSHVRYVNKHTLIARYPEYAAEIQQAATDPSNYQRVRGAENVRVDESWLLAKGSKYGRHVCCIATCDLVDEVYEYETPPFVSLAWGLPFQGWYAQGLIDQLVGLQLEINEILDIIHEALRLFAHPFMLIENGSNVNLAHIQDIPGKLIKYTNTRPEIVAAQLLSPEVYSHLERCYQKAYEIAGINPYNAQAKTLPRYESSKAMRMATEQGEVRHFNFGQACERYHTELATLVCREASIAAEEDDYKTRMPRSQYFKTIPWKDINYDVQTYQICIDTINKQATSIAANVQDLQDLAQMQMLSLPELRRYLQNPDVNRVLRTLTASDEYIDWAIHQLTYEERSDLIPSQFMDWQQAFKECVAEYLTGLRLGMSDTAKENLFNYILALQALMKQAAADAQQEQAQAQAQAQAMMQAPAQAQLPLTQPGSQV